MPGRPFRRGALHSESYWLHRPRTNYVTCADCEEYALCETVQAFLHHPGYKYSKYRQALAFIRARGYDAFLKKAEDWKNAYGKLE